jgi:hypothetical protein
MDLEWRTGPPPKHGYYLGAWRHGESWTVSELWFNPDSHGSGWWAERGYLEPARHPAVAVDVEAWMPVPAYTGKTS